MLPLRIAPPPKQEPPTPIPMQRAKSRSKAVKRRRRDTFRALFACIGLTCVLVVAAFAGLRAPEAPDRGDEAEFLAMMRTGSILFVPSHGNRCRRKLIDNVSGQTWDIGFVDCDVAVAQALRNHQKEWVAERVEGIRAGLTKRQP
jgi:hypothetical protein